MGFMDELKADGMRTGAMLGGLLAFAALFYLWAKFGTIGLIVILILFGGCMALFMMWKKG